MTGEARFAKWRSAAGPLQHPPRRFDVHALDHLIAEPLRAAAECRDQRSRPLDLRLARRKGPVARRDLVGVDQALAVEAEAPPVFALRRRSRPRPSRSLKTPSNAAMPQRARRARSSAAMRRSARGVAPSGKRRSARRSLVPAISPAQIPRDLGRGKHACRRFDHRQHRLADRFGDFAHEMRRDGARHDDQLGVRPRHRIEVERMPLRSRRR